jgi:arginyl-tRNA synthetase
MNPVFYLQYAHARVCSIMARAKAIEIEPDLETSLDILTKDIELRLIRKLLDFPVIVRKSAISLEPQSIATYLQETASIFHKFYAHERVISDDAELTAARMVLIAAFRIVIFNGLTLLGLSAPEKM